jgi:hypothetical protein
MYQLYVLQKFVLKIYRQRRVSHRCEYVRQFDDDDNKKVYYTVLHALLTRHQALSCGQVFPQQQTARANSTGSST